MSLLPFLSLLIFCAGLFLVLSKKNIILILIGAELLLQAACINFVYFDYCFSLAGVPRMQGQLFVLFLLPLAVSEIAIALTFVIAGRDSSSSHSSPHAESNPAS